MSTPFRLGGTMFMDADRTLTLTPYEGQSAGVPFKTVAVKSLDFGDKGKAVAARGAEIEAASLGLGESLADWKIDFDVMKAAVDYTLHCGNGWKRMRHDGALIFTRPGLAPVTFHLEFMIIEEGGGVKSGGSAQPTDGWSGKARKVLIETEGQKIDPFALPKGGGGGGFNSGGLSVEFGVSLEFG
jgi:hypothetical protein